MILSKIREEFFPLENYEKSKQIKQVQIPVLERNLIKAVIFSLRIQSRNR